MLVYRLKSRTECQNLRFVGRIFPVSFGLLFLRMCDLHMGAHILWVWIIQGSRIFISRGAEGPGREILQRLSVCLSRLVFAL